MLICRPIREARPEDNEQLIELARRCPIQGHLHFYSDRYPDFFALLRLQGEKFHIFVSDGDDGRIVACAVFVERSVVWEGRLVKTLHFGDLRTDPDVRRSRVSLEFIKKYDALLREGDFHHGVAEFAAGSKTAVNAQKYLSKEIEVCYDGCVRMFQLIPLWTYRVSRRWTYRQARLEDLPGIAAILQDTYRGTTGSPPFSLEWLEAALELHSSFTIDNLWVATDSEGAIVATVGMWDQAPVRQVVATQFSKVAKFAVRFLAMTGFLWRLPPVPREGRALAYMIFRWPAMRSGQEEPLRALLRFLLNQVRREGKHQFVTAGFHENDRMLNLLRGFVKVEDRVQLYSHRVLARQVLPALPSAAPAHYADLAIV